MTEIQYMEELHIPSNVMLDMTKQPDKYLRDTGKTIGPLSIGSPSLSANDFPRTEFAIFHLSKLTTFSEEMSLLEGEHP